MNVVLFGPPGVGKGTQGVRLTKDYQLTLLATGDLLRSEVKSGTSLGMKAKAFMDAGGLVPDDVVVGMIESRLVDQGGLLLDGFPRNTAQAEALDRMLASHGQQLDRVVFLCAEQDVLVERLCGRRVCRGCGRGFHLQYDSPKVSDVCDHCGGELYQRDDDHAEVISQRLAVYEEQTAPLASYYEGRTGFYRIDGSASLEQVHAELVRALEG
ncbi:MAG: adenylate kinase [Mariprofundales bacterium]|nr:adenylate kinase [Mariprofundales bacterium]